MMHFKSKTPMRSANLPSYWVVFVLLSVPAVVLGLVPDAVDRYGWDALLVQTQPWRYLTCHLVHLNATHAAANLVALVLLGWIASCLNVAPGQSGVAVPAAPAGVWAMVFGAWGVISVGLASRAWGVEWYAGMSGLLYGIYAGCALRIAMRRGWLGCAGMLLLLAGAARIGVDLLAGVGAVGALGVPVAAPVHLHGYLGGLLGVTMRGAWRCLRTP
jgi:membrane associated rhomboid family serine protease